MTQRRLALRMHVGVVVVHVEQRFRRVLDAPHDDVGDLDGVAALVVHLEVLAVVRAGAQRDLRGLRDGLARGHVDRGAGVAGVERVGPVETFVAHGALVVAEQDEHARLVRLDGEEAHQQQDGRHAYGDDARHQQRNAERLRRGRDRRIIGRSHGRPRHDQRDAQRDDGEQKRQHRPAAPCMNGLLDGHDDPFLSQAPRPMRSPATSAR